MDPAVCPPRRLERAPGTKPTLVAARGCPWRDQRTGQVSFGCVRGLLHFPGELFHGEFRRRVPVRQNRVPRKRNLFHITQISVGSIRITDELDVNLMDENQYRSRLLAGTLVGRSLLILGESRSIIKDGRCFTFP